MNDLHEIVDLHTVDRVFILLAIVVPILGAVSGAWWGRLSGRMRYGLIVGISLGMLGPLNLLLWHIYNLITARNGLDTVRNLQINLLVFIATGAVIGLTIGIILKRSAFAPVSSETDKEAISEPV